MVEWSELPVSTHRHSHRQIYSYARTQTHTRQTQSRNRTYRYICQIPQLDAVGCDPKHTLMQIRTSIFYNKYLYVYIYTYSSCICTYRMRAAMDMRANGDTYQFGGTCIVQNTINTWQRVKKKKKTIFFLFLNWWNRKLFQLIVYATEHFVDIFDCQSVIPTIYLTTNVALTVPQCNLSEENVWCEIRLKSSRVLGRFDSMVFKRIGSLRCAFPIGRLVGVNWTRPTIDAMQFGFIMRYAMAVFDWMILHD